MDTLVDASLRWHDDDIFLASALETWFTETMTHRVAMFAALSLPQIYAGGEWAYSRHG